jgi:hypothetical protein
MAITKIHPIKSTLKSSLAYVLEGKKTNEGILVSSFACSPETADLEFGFTLSHCMEKGNNLAFHLMQSFKPGETDAVTAHKIGKDLADSLLNGNYEYVLGTHIDKGHIHNHIIFCAANFNNYRKFISNRKSYYLIRRISDKLCEEFGLSVVVPQSNRGNSYQEHMARKDGISWKTRIRKTLDLAIKGSVTYEEFLIKAQILGLEFREGKHLAFRHIGDDYYVNAETLGSKYRESRIKESIVSNTGQKENIREISFPRHKKSIKLQELKLSAKTTNNLISLGIDTYEKLELRQKEIAILLQDHRKKIRMLESKIREQSGIAKQLKVLEAASTNSTYPRKCNESKRLRALSNAAITYLKDQNIEPPYPLSSSVSKGLNVLREQKGVLYQIYNEARQEQKQLQNVNEQIKRAFVSINSSSLDKSQ